MSHLRVTVGKKPGWETGKDKQSPAGGDKMDVDVEEKQDDEKNLKSISEVNLVLYQSLRSSRQRWLFAPPFLKFPKSSRLKPSIDIKQPPHTTNYIGTCDVEIGPHVFLQTKIYEVNYKQSQTDAVDPNVPKAATSTDVLMEFFENKDEHFVVPLDCSIIERILRLGVPPTILLSTVIPALPAGVPPTENAPQHPFTIHFVHAGTPLWEAMQKRVISSKMPIQTVQHVLQQAVNAPVPRVFIPHRLPAGLVLDRIAEQMSDKYDAKPMVLKALRDAPLVQEPPRKKRIVQQPAAPAKSQVTSIITSSGRHSTAVMRESPDPSDPSSSKKKYERRIKVSCSVCKKSINRKAEEVGNEAFKPMCRQCASDARKARDIARAAAAPTPIPRPLPPPRMTVEVVMPPRIGVPYSPAPRGALQWPAGVAGASASSSSFNLFSPRPPPAPHLTPYTPYTPTPIPGAAPTAQSAGTPITNPYAYTYRHPPPPVPASALASTSSSSSPVAPGPPAHPYTGRYYGAATPDGHTWRPPLYTAPPYNLSNPPPPPSRATPLNRPPVPNVGSAGGPRPTAGPSRPQPPRVGPGLSHLPPAPSTRPQVVITTPRVSSPLARPKPLNNAKSTVAGVSSSAQKGSESKKAD